MTVNVVVSAFYRNFAMSFPLFLFLDTSPLLYACRFIFIFIIVIIFLAWLLIHYFLYRLCVEITLTGVATVTVDLKFTTLS